LLGGKAHLATEVSDDLDFTVIGPSDTEFTKDEGYDVEYAAPHISIESYLNSRDFTVNEVAMDSSTIYLSDAAYAAIQDGVVELSENQTASSRTYYRAIRFACKYGMENQHPAIPDWWCVDFDRALQGVKALNSSEKLFLAYLQKVALSPESFCKAVFNCGLMEAKSVACRLEEMGYRI
jgi:hypothetical protein